jgi:uncharacterized protein (UPF0332 family)
MSLQQWAKNGWLRKHATSRNQVASLIAIADRDLEDSARGISDDWKFGIAYNAVLKLCTVLLYCEGYRPEKNLAHYRTLQALPLILGESRKNDAEYLDRCRTKRNITEYDSIGQISKEEASELMAFAQELREEVLTWLKQRHPDLSPF